MTAEQIGTALNAGYSRESVILLARFEALVTSKLLQSQIHIDQLRDEVLAGLQNREQNLIDLMFSVLMKATDPATANWFLERDVEQKAEWLRQTLKACGI